MQGGKLNDYQQAEVAKILERVVKKNYEDNRLNIFNISKDDRSDLISREISNECFSIGISSVWGAKVKEPTNWFKSDFQYIEKATMIGIDYDNKDFKTILNAVRRVPIKLRDETYY